MTKFNPNFWEVSLSHEDWRQFTTADRLGHEEPEDLTERHERGERAKALVPRLREVMDEVLTERQRDVVELYFFSKLNQREIAERLDLSQQTVSEHLYGKMRNGQAVGGAMRKLRAECARRGLRWE
jgi:RNA polymerase sigma factor (sigma-70 family)